MTKTKPRKHMYANMERQSAYVETGAARLYRPELQPVLQSLLVALANIDFEHESDIETVRSSVADDWLKQTTIRNLNKHHLERRARCLRQLEGVQKRMQAEAA
jgi:hypothetical protein